MQFILLAARLALRIQNQTADQQEQRRHAHKSGRNQRRQSANQSRPAVFDENRDEQNQSHRKDNQREQAEKEKQQLLADAQKQADAIVAEGKRNAEAERQHKLREADAQTTALAREMCEKLLARNLTQQDDARLLDDLLQKAGVDDGN